MKPYTDSMHEAVRIAPPVGAAGWSVLGLPMSDWMIVLTVIYTLFLLIDKLPIVLERIAQFRAYMKRRKK